MIQKTVLIVWILFGFTVLTGTDLYDRDQEKEFLRLQIDKSRVLAFSGRMPPVSVDLGTGENVRMKEEEGYVGALLTDRRFLAISSVSGKWLSESLHPGEGNYTDLTVGEKIAMLITERRIVGFTYRRDRLVEYELPVGDTVIARGAEENFGVAVMSDRAVGLSSATGDFREIEFHIGETFRSLEMAATFALINTDENIYSYRGSSGTWSTRPKPDMR